MSVNHSTKIAFVSVPQAYVPMLRYALGATLLMSVAMAFAWDMAYLTPVLGLSFLAPGTKIPSLKQGLGFVLTIVATTFIGFVFTRFFLGYILFFIPAMALSLLGLFYTQKLAASTKIFMLVALLFLPMLGMQGAVYAYGLMFTLITSSCITIAMVWLVFALIPDHPSAIIDTKKKPDVEKGEAQSRFDLALEILIIVFPMVLVFFFFNLVDSLLTLFYLVMFTIKPTFNLKAGMAMIIGNFTGGIVAIIAYQLFTIVPFFPFFMLVVAAASLVFAQGLFSGKKTAAIYGMAFSTFLLIIGQSTTSTDDAGGKVWVRLLQIMIAVVYVVMASAVLAAFKEKWMTKHVKIEN